MRVIKIGDRRFVSQTAAAQALDCSQPAVSMALSGEHTLQGEKPVYEVCKCVVRSDGEAFLTQVKAAEAIGVKQPSIAYALRNDSECKGWKFSSEN